MSVRIAKLFFKLFFLGVFFVLGIQAYQISHSSKCFPVKFVHIYGAHHIEHSELQRLLTPLLTHNFFMVDMELAQDRLLQFSWVENIAIRRTWPDRIDVLVTEHVPIARWRDSTLLSANGNLFNPGEYKNASDLPQFVGADGGQGTMLQYFNELNRELSALHAKIIRLELAPYEVWQLTLDNGIRLRLGHKNILTRINQFVKVYPKIIGDRAKDVEYIDLRYSNGIAIRWKDSTDT